jgi:AraC family transcriptional regulator
MKVSSPGRAAFSIEETHGIALYPSNRLLTHSDHLGWHSAYASYASERPWTSTLSPLSHPCIAYFVDGRATITRRLEGEAAQVAELHPRQFGFVPTDVASHWVFRGSADVLLVYLRKAMVDRLAAEVFGRDPRHVELRPQLGFTDPLFEQLALALLRVMCACEEESGLYVDHLAQTMAVQMLRGHCSGIGVRAPLTATMSVSKLGRIVEYIDAALDGELTLDVMAEVTGMNPFHFARTFRRQFGETPHRYVLRRRIERAKRLLSESETPLVEIALTCGFASQSHFTSTFRRQVGVTPSQYRNGRS